MRALVIFAYFATLKPPKSSPDFQPICKKCWAAAVCEARPRRGSGTRPRGSPAPANKGFAAPAALALAGSDARQKRPDCSRQARRGLRAISGQSHAKRRVVRCALFCRVRAALLFGTRVLVSKRCAAPPRTGCRFGNARALRQGWQVCGCSAVYVISQDWQDRWNVAQIGDIPETGDPRCQSRMPAPHAPSVSATCR